MNKNDKTKATDSTMNGKTTRATLLTKASTITLAAAAASVFGAAGASADCLEIGGSNGATITSPEDCVVISGPVIGTVTNQSVIGPASSTPSLLVTGGVTGSFVNSGSIVADTSVAMLVIGGGASIGGGITNTGLIASTQSDAVVLADNAFVDRIVNTGTITSGLIGVDASEGVFIANGIRNGEDGVIIGGVAGIRLTDEFGDMDIDGGIDNGGRIHGDEIGVLLATTDVDGGIINRAHGEISGGASAGVEETHVAIWIRNGDGYTTFSGGLTNRGLITAHSGGFVFEGQDFLGDIVNSGTISVTGVSNSGYAAVHVGNTSGFSEFSSPAVLFAGNVSNSGTIDGGLGIGLQIAAETVGGPNTVLQNAIEFFSLSNPPLVTALDNEASEFANSGLIQGDRGGVFIQSDEQLLNFTNSGSGQILSYSGTAVRIDADDWTGNFSNAGLIEGGNLGVLISSDLIFGNKSFEGNFSNSGTIVGGVTGAALDMGFITGDIVNSGTILAGQGALPASFDIAIESIGGAGLRVGDFTTNAIEGTISNSGLIMGDNGVVIESTTVFNGSTFQSLTNSGTISTFSNSGTIIGVTDAGVAIDVGAWYGTIENSGTIRGGETGFYVEAEGVEGDFINDGTIIGGGLETGVHIIASSYTGDIINNDYLSAAGNALHTEIDAFDGHIVNTGTISATGSNAVGVLLEGGESGGTYLGGFTNSGAIVTTGTLGTALEIDDIILSDGILNDGGTIDGDVAIDASNAEGSLVITNTAGGIIHGDILLGLEEDTEFVGNDGGVYGQISGSGGVFEDVYDDDISIEDGTQFIVGGVDGIGHLDIREGGTALFGTDQEGVDGDGFTGTEVLYMEVHDGGRLYMDDNANLDVGEADFDDGSEIVFYLTSEEGVHGSITTSGSINSITIGEGARLSVALDAQSFANTQQTDFEYTNVINSGSIVGEFANGSVHGSPFFDLEVVYGSGSVLNAAVSAENVANAAADPVTSVNLLLHRNSFADLSCSSSTQNNEALGQMLEQAYQAGDLTADQLALYQALLNSTDACAAADAYDDLSGTPFDFIAFQLDGPFKKMVGARIDSGRATGCIVAGTTGCFDRYAANTTAGSNVMTDATPGEDPFAWLKTGVRAKGADAIWARGVGAWGDTDGDSSVGAPGTRSSQRGGIIGADHVFTQDFLAGAAVQYTETRIKFPGHADRVHVNSYEAGAYMSLGDTQGYINANASYIWHNFDTSRLVGGVPTWGQFDGDTISGYIEAGRIYEAGNFRLQPIVALSLSTLTTEGYTEQGASPNRLVVKESSFDCLKSIVGGRFAYPIEFDNGRRWVPEARISWSHELLDNRADFDARLFSFPEIAASYFSTRGAAADRNALIVGSGLNAPVSDSLILYADYDATLSSDQTSQTASGGFRILW